jgi:hypothetical protein
VPGVANGAQSTVTACSVNLAGFTYDGGCQGCTGSAASGGANCRPSSLPAWLIAMSTANARSHVTGIFTIVEFGPADSLNGVPTRVIGPCVVINPCQGSYNASAGASSRSSGARRLSIPANRPACSICITVLAVAIASRSIAKTIVSQTFLSAAQAVVARIGPMVAQPVQRGVGCRCH